MSTKLLLTAKLDQRLQMSQQLTQAITLLQYNTLDLKLLVQQYIETNPLIETEDTEATCDNDTIPLTTHTEEEDGHAFKYSADMSRTNRQQIKDDTLETYATPKTLREHLLEQTWLCKFSADEQICAEAIIDAIDDNGYMTMQLSEIREKLSEKQEFHQVDLLNILSIIQTFDPPGIGAYDIRECLLIQLNALTNKDKTWILAERILNECLEILASHNIKKIIKQLNITQAEFANAMNLIRSLNPKPGLLYANEINQANEPELYLKKIKNTWQVFLTESILTNLKINHLYQEMIKQHKKHASYEELNRNVQEAQWLIKGLKRRNETLLKVATHIIKFQQEFIEHGEAFMRPMNIIDIASELNLHESTVSRVTNGKYISTPRGVFELKYFFPSYVLKQSGETCSDTAVKEFIKDILAQESEKHIYSDGDIALLLKQKGINIARRTVAKYREAMKILPSYQRAHQFSLLVDSKSE